MNFNVVKRNGQKEELKTCKIKAVIGWACSGLDVNPLELESKIETIIKDEITTEEIHDNIIYHAQSLARAEVPDWVYVAGRLNTMKLWKDTRAYDTEFYAFIKDMQQEGKYTHPNIDKYSEEDINFLEKFIKQDRDLDHSYGSTLTANSKYLMEGEVIQYMFMVQAMIIFHNKPLDRVVDLYNALSLRKISLATPWLSSLRSNGNISSCFIVSMDDDLESITDTWKKVARISKMGGGVGIYLGHLRAKGSSINGKKGAAKSISAGVKVLNDIAVYIDQGGKRAGAFTPALPVWHNDIEEFLEIQAEHGDVRSKSYDVFPQVCTPDLFWEAVLGDGEWHTFCPKEAKDLGYELNTWGEEFENNYLHMVNLAKEGKVSIFNTIKAKDLVKKTMRTQFETGLPYITYTDTLNEGNPNKHEGFIPCFNLCTESTSVLDPYNYSHTCNLASLVVGRLEKRELIPIAGLLVEVLDEGIELTSPPTDCSSRHNNRYRTIGVGIQGYHDWVAKNWSSYYDVELATELAEYIQYGCVKKSIELAKEKGAYPAFKGSEWDIGNTFDKYKERSVTDLNWKDLEFECAIHGIRNSQLTSPAPNTSTSVFMDASAGVPPVYAAFFREDNDNGKYPISCMHLKENPMAYMKSFRTYDQAALSATVGAMQKFVDTGISAEYLFDQNREGFSAKDLYDLLINSWKNGCKAVYYVRTIKKGETVDDLLGIKEGACAGCDG